MKRLLIAVLVTLASVTARGDEISPLSLVRNHSWEKLAQAQIIKDNRPQENDLSELIARLAIVSTGEDLNPDALNRTLMLANNPKGGFGIIKNDGLKWMASLLIIGNYDLQARVKIQERRLQQQQEQIEELKNRVIALEAQIASGPSSK